MMTWVPVVIDILLLLIVLFCAYNGFRKGFILGLTGIIAIVVALYGANLVADTFSGTVQEAMTPFVEGLVEKSVNDAKDETAEPDYEFYGPEEGRNDEVYKVSYESLRNLGILKSAAEKITQDVRKEVTKVGNDLKNKLIEKLTEKLSYVATFVIAFILIIIIFVVLANIINLAFKLPGLELVNELLGLILGLVKGFAIVFCIAWLARFFGLLLPEGAIDKTLILAWLIKVNPLTLFLPI
jgi:uncharacterized membrane protein required for colicin V production